MRDQLDQRNIEKDEVRRYKGQPYKCEGVEFVEHTEGFSTVIRWSSACAECGAPIEFTRPLESPSTYPPRRCVLHKKPGKRV